MLAHCWPSPFCHPIQEDCIPVGPENYMLRVSVLANKISLAAEERLCDDRRVFAEAVARSRHPGRRLVHRFGRTGIDAGRRLGLGAVRALRRNAGGGCRRELGHRPSARPRPAESQEVAPTMTTVPTSAGEVDVTDLGVVLMHEHVFIRTEQLQWGWPGFGGWDTEVEVAAARERLSLLKRTGVDTILD